MPAEQRAKIAARLRGNLHSVGHRVTPAQSANLRQNKKGADRGKEK